MQKELKLDFVIIASTHNHGILRTWANHPEVLWNANTAITSDFVHYLREGIESGIQYADRTMQRGLGGTTVFMNGAVGGLMTTLDATPVVDAVLNETLLTPSFEKARAVGYRVAEAILGGVAASANSNRASKREVKLAYCNWETLGLARFRANRHERANEHAPWLSQRPNWLHHSKEPMG